VLPVSLTVLLADFAAAADDTAVDGGDELELLQAASMASGTSVAAVHTIRNLFPTGEISFALRASLARCSCCTLRVPIGPARGCGFWAVPAGAHLLRPGRVSG
jgi:hypothetical protein